MHTQETFQMLSQLKAQSGSTSLITYYLQGGSSLWLAVEKLTTELSTASNIKSKSTRKDVELSLKQSLYQLKNYSSFKVPENGLVLCSGNVIENKSCV
jgi:peptide chain release factor subunit 1